MSGGRSNPRAAGPCSRLETFARSQTSTYYCNNVFAPINLPHTLQNLTSLLHLPQKPARRHRAPLNACASRILTVETSASR